MSVQPTKADYVKINLNQEIAETELNEITGVALTILDESTSPNTSVESLQPSRWTKLKKWFRESGDPKGLRPPRWKRLALLTLTSAAAVAGRVLTTDTIIHNAAALLSAVQINAEIYDWSDRNKILFLSGITILTTLGELLFFPDSDFLRKAALPGLCWGLVIRTFSIESQKWININAAQNK